MPDPSRIRNFSIVAHIDHGKTTLSDRILEITGALTAREMREQVLDDNPIEKERGITIKARAVSLNYKSEDGAGLGPEPDRHARPRRLHLRGLPVAGGVRGGGPRRRRDAGGRGADARERLPRDPRQPDDHPLHQQGRPPERGPGDGPRADRGGHRDPGAARRPHVGEGRHRRPRAPRADRPRHPGARGQPGRRRSAPSSSTPGSTSTAASPASSASRTGRSGPG